MSFEDTKKQNEFNAGRKSFINKSTKINRAKLINYPKYVWHIVNTSFRSNLI